MVPLGFLGVGTLATAMVRGLRQQWLDLPIHLSPRSEQVSRALAEQDRLITRHPSNHAVVEVSGIVVLSMRPPQLDAAARGLPFRRDQVVISCVAGTPLAEVQALVGSAQVCRAIPVPTIARRQGPLVLYPALPAVRALFDGQGDLIEAPDEAAFAAFVAASAMMSTYFCLQGTMAGWMTAHGVGGGPAASYVRSLLRALAETGVRTSLDDLPSLVGAHETPGGLNERVRQSLEKRGWFEAVGSAYDAIARLRRDDLKTEGDS